MSYLPIMIPFVDLWTLLDFLPSYKSKFLSFIVIIHPIHILVLFSMYGLGFSTYMFEDDVEVFNVAILLLWI